MTCTDATTSIGRLSAGPPVTGSVTFALFTSAPLWVLRVPLRLTCPSGPRTTPGMSGSELSNRSFTLGASRRVNHILAVLVGFSFECGWSAEFHRGASYKGLVPCSILNKHCSFDLSAAGVRLFPPRRQREQADDECEKREEDYGSSRRGVASPFSTSIGSFFRFPQGLLLKCQSLFRLRWRLRGTSCD